MRLAVVLTDRSFGGKTKLIFRIAAAHDDEAAERIGAVVQALRPAQHFDAIDIERRRGHAHAAEIDIVDQEADGRIRRALPLLALTDAANLEETRT